MSSPPPVRVALVGLGDIALAAHLPALLRCADVELAALVDPAAPRRDAAAAKAPGVALRDNIDAVLADPSIQAIVLATPPWVTTELARQCLLAGRYCLAEKPIGVCVDSASALTALSAPAQARLQVGLTYRHDPAMAVLRGWLGDGLLGSPLLVRAHIYDELRRTDDAHYTRRMMATLEHGSPVIHEGGHVFDWLTYLLGGGPVVIEDAWALHTEPGLSAPNLTGARLSWPQGATVLAEFGWWTSAQPPAELSFLGCDGWARLDLKSYRLERHDRAGDEVVELPGNWMARSFDNQLRCFVGLARGEVDRAVPGLVEGLSVLRLSERIAAAAQSGASETVTVGAL